MRKILFISVCISFIVSVSFGQVRIRDRSLANISKPSVIDDIFPNTGSMIGGNLWDSFMPMSTGVYYSEIKNNPNRLWDLVRIGNFDRWWDTPTSMWPGGYPYSYYWNQDLIAVEYSPGINEGKQLSASPDYAAMIYTSSIDSLWQKHFGMHSYVIGPIWVNPDGTPDPNGTNRYELYYEAGFPTNLGIWVTFRAVQYSQPWNHFNDFIIVGLTFKNYGLLDVKADGNPTSTTNKINALALGWFSGDAASVTIALNGKRSYASYWSVARMSGYIADPDPNGSPWDTQVGYAGVNTGSYSSYPGPNSEVPLGQRDMGLNAYANGFYTDVWLGKTWIAVKDDSLGIPSAPDAHTIFGTDAIGTGAQRGWFTSSGTGLGNLDNRLDASIMHTIFMGEFYADGGKSNDASKVNMNPNPNFFQSGTAGNPLTFVPKSSPGKPDGDKKSTNSLQNIWENGWTKGYSTATNFDGDSFIGTGPYSLNVGQSITVVGAEYAGFRMQGMLQSLQAARTAYQDQGVPISPAAPDIKTTITSPDNKVQVEWTKVPNESDPNFGGYKVYRASAFPTFSSTALGFRTIQNYTDQMHAGNIDSTFYDPINPNFDATGKLHPMQAGYWGPWRIQAIIPKDSLQYFIHQDGNYTYAFKDNSLDDMLGFSYWYYVAAYNNLSSPLAINGQSTSHLESGRVNENGGTGTWQGTFPWATQNSFYPTTVAGQKAIGATIIVQSAPVSSQSLAAGTVKIGVRPNPYKKEAFFDVGLEHKIMFYNLPSQCKITILDVSGQIVDQINYASPNPTNGTFFWDMYSKDGIEVANGLYIYVVQYNGGQQTGYFAILR